MRTAVVALALLAVSGCGGGRCIPGIERACAIKGQVQVCSRDGLSFGPCHVPKPYGPAKTDNVDGWESFAARKRDERLHRQREFK